MKKLGNHRGALILKAVTQSNAIQQLQLCCPCHIEVLYTMAVFWSSSLTWNSCFVKKCDVLLCMVLRKDTHLLEEEVLISVTESRWKRWTSTWGHTMRASTGISAAKGKPRNTRNAPVLNGAEALVMRGKKNTEVQNVILNSFFFFFSFPG